MIEVLCPLCINCNPDRLRIRGFNLEIVRCAWSLDGTYAPISDFPTNAIRLENFSTAWLRHGELSILGHGIRAPCCVVYWTSKLVVFCFFVSKNVFQHSFNPKNSYIQSATTKQSISGIPKKNPPPAMNQESPFLCMQPHDKE